ncbi:glycosyltransferase family 4 protein [Halarcobacter ebronensis]|nr:glycosyltransferase family 4 protein [Halarcobacter ebronensis]
MDKKILEICLSPDLGGLELYMKDLTIELKAMAVIGKNSRLDSYFDKNEISYLKLKKRAFLTLAKIIDKNEIDIIHLHWTKDLPIAVLAKLFSKRKPKIVQTRHMHMTRFKDDFYHKFLYKNLDAIIAVTKLVKKQLEEFIPNDVRPKIFESYIGAKDFQEISQEKKNELKEKYNIKDEFIVSIVGRIEIPKGQHIVLEAVKKLRESKVAAKTLVIGHTMDENYLDKLKNLYKEDIFTGFVNNANELMQISNCLVLATKKETFGLVLIEAMKCGICVLGNNKGGPLEIIEDNKSGLLFDDEKENDLFEKLQLIQKDDELRKTLAQNGKNRAKEIFDSKKQFDEIKKILEESI